MRSQPSTRVVGLIGFYVRPYELIKTKGIGMTKGYHGWNPTGLATSRMRVYIRDLGRNWFPPRTNSYDLHWFLKESLDSFLELTCPIFPRRNVGTEVRCVRTLTFGSCGSQVLRSVTTGRHLTHQRLANWRIATFSEIDSRQHAMAYDTRPHEWGYQPWILAEKNLQEEKNSPPRIWGVIWMRG